MLKNNATAYPPSSLTESMRDTAGVTLLAGALALGIHDLTAAHYQLGHSPGGLSGAALGDMGTGSSRAVLEEARAEAMKDAQGSQSKTSDLDKR